LYSQDNLPPMQDRWQRIWIFRDAHTCTLTGGAADSTLHAEVQTFSCEKKN
jgi:hypothetical protein